MRRFILSVMPSLLLITLAINSALAQSPALPPTVGVGTTAIPGLMDNLLKNGKTPQELWDDKQLDGDLLIDVLNEQPWGRTENRAMAQQLCALLVKTDADQLKTPLTLPPRTRLRLAQYFKSIKDSRAVTYYEAILSLIKAPRETGVREIFELSDYYSDIGDWEMAAETRLRMKDYTTAEPYLANATVEAARVYAEHGEMEKAQPLYEQAQQSSYGWAAGMALYDQGIQLIRQEKYQEAIKVLSKSVKGQYADQVQVGILSTLGYAYLRKGDVEHARQSSKQAIEIYQRIDTPLQGEGLQELEQDAQERIRLIDRWKNHLYVLPLKTPLAIRDEQGIYHATFYVHSFIKGQPVTILFNDLTVQLKALKLNKQHSTRRGVIVEQYEITYTIDQHPEDLEVKVIAISNPKEQENINIRYINEDI